MLQQWFTPASARRTLRRIRPAVEKLHRLFRELELRRPLKIDSDERVDPLYFSMLDKLTRGLDELDREGLEAGELRQGMLDFPAYRDGRPVLLCWKVGEPSVRFWHEPGQGFDRRRVDENGPWDEQD
jgi:hypothetical protein